MNKLFSFPEKYEYINRYLAEIYFPSSSFGINEINDNQDVIITLKDGRCYSFTAFTPDNIKFLLDKDNALSFVSPGLIMVRFLNVNCVLDAVENCLALEIDGHTLLGHFGILQRGLDEDDDDEVY